jgi:hypothetical protein
MHARVTTISGGSPDGVDRGIANFTDNVVPGVKEISGGRGAIMLVNRETGEGMAITLWDDEAAMRSSEERANELRASAVEALGSTEEPRVGRYEVAVFDV